MYWPFEIDVMIDRNMFLYGPRFLSCLSRVLSVHVAPFSDSGETRPEERLTHIGVIHCEFEIL